MASIRVRTATGLFFTALVVAALYSTALAPPGIIAWVVGFLLGGLAAFELGRMGKLAGPQRALVLPLLSIASALAVLFVLLRGPTPWETVAWLLGIQAATFAIGACLGLALPGPNAGQLEARFLIKNRALGFLAAWVGPPMAALGLVHLNYGTIALTVLLVLSKLGDVAGYFVGKSIGRSHPFPSLSPGKTTAGCVASLLAGIAAGAGVAALDYLPGTSSLLAGACVGGVLNIAAQAADLFESYVKRTADVKDSSGMAGASGGVLDVIDSLLFTIPVGLVLFGFLVT